MTAVFTPTAKQIEWWTGEKMNFETAADLGIAEFTNGNRTLRDYVGYARRKQRMREEERRMWQRWMVTRNPWLRYRLHQKVQARARHKYWRMWSCPTLRKCWAITRERHARNRRERELCERREKILKSIELFKYSTRKDI